MVSSIERQNPISLLCELFILLISRRPCGIIVSGRWPNFPSCPCGPGNQLFFDEGRAVASSLPKFHEISLFRVKTIHEIIAIFVELFLLTTSRYWTFVCMTIESATSLTDQGGGKLPSENRSHSWILIVIHLPWIKYGYEYMSMVTNLNVRLTLLYGHLMFQFASVWRLQSSQLDASRFMSRASLDSIISFPPYIPSTSDPIDTFDSCSSRV